MWNFKDYRGDDVTWYSEEEYNELLKEIEELKAELNKYKVHYNES